MWLRIDTEGIPEDLYLRRIAEYGVIVSPGSFHFAYPQQKTYFRLSIGMLNEDVSDLFERTKVGTRVVVMPGGPPPGTATANAAPPAGANGAPVAAAAPQAPVGPIPGQGPAVVQPLPPPTTIR